MAAREQINRIVVRGTNWLGDAVMSVPALREMARIFPDAEIVLHTNRAVAGLFEDVDFIDGILPFDRGSSRIKQTVAQADALTDEEFDVAVLFPNSFESALTTRLARIPLRIGYNKDLRGLLLTDPIAVPEWKTKRHEVYYYLNLIAHAERRFLGSSTVTGAEPNIDLAVSESRQAKARQFLKESGVDLSRPIIALGVGSTNSIAKRWGEAKFAEMNDRAKTRLGASTILIGAPSETDVSKTVMDLARAKPIDLTGKTSVAEAAALLSVCDLLVANDMGLAHVAPAVGTRTVVIFGPTNHVTTRPFSDNAVVVRHNVECSPCMLRECPIDHRCMLRVEVDEVYTACEGLLAPIMAK